MKRLRVILLFLLLGAIVNVAVAWSFASLVSFDTFTKLGKSFGPGVTSETGACWILDRKEFLGSTHIFGDGLLETDHSNIRIRKSEYYSSLDDSPRVPEWSQFADPPTVRIRMNEESRGWPFRTLSWFSTMEPLTGASTVQHTWVIRESPNEIYLPLAPIWRGLLLNTLFYAAILWLLIPGPFVTRRYIRLKRGLCVKCAYDLRGADHESCPECGEEIRKVNPV